jgi:hypothetical protein
MDENSADRHTGADRATGSDRATGVESQRQELGRLPVEERLRVSVVDPNNLPPIWDEVAELLGPACDTSFGQDTIKTLRASLMSGNEGLFVIESLEDIIGAVTYEVITYDTGLRVLAINYAGGVNMDSQMPSVIDMFHALKRHFMCDRVRVTGRKGWIRYMRQFGFTDTHYSVEME